MGHATRDIHSCLLKVEGGSVYVARRVSTHTTQNTLIHTRFSLCSLFFFFVSRLMRNTNMTLIVGWIFFLFVQRHLLFSFPLVIRCDLLSKYSLKIRLFFIANGCIHEVLGV